jgi:glycosyltransferase involved in cell wall biosynthesis
LRVSVLLTCYNHIAYLPDAIRSLDEQTFRDFEVIALDDGSTDGTRDYLVAEAAKRNNWTLQFNETNLGTYGSLNKGLELATGELIAVFNDDDVWEPTKLQGQIELLDAHPEVGLVHTNGIFIGAKGEQLPGTPLGFDFPETETGNGILTLIYSNKIIASAVLVRRKCFEECGSFDAEYFGSGDWDMWLRIAEKFDIGYCIEKQTRYRWHGDNASKKLDRIYRDDARLRNRIHSMGEDYSKRGFDPMELRLALAHNLACLGTVHTLNGDAKAGRSSYQESLRLAPGRWKTYARWVATFLPANVFRRLT